MLYLGKRLRKGNTRLRNPFEQNKSNPNKWRKTKLESNQKNHNIVGAKNNTDVYYDNLSKMSNTIKSNTTNAKIPIGHTVNTNNKMLNS